MKKLFPFHTVLRCAFLALIVSGCSFDLGGGPSYDEVSSDKARLAFAWRTLAGAKVQHRWAERGEAGYRVERARWDGKGGEQAELMLIEALNAKGLEVPDDPKDELANFTDIVHLQTTFGPLYQSNTAVGPAVWRRFVAGDRSCVILNQRWDGGANTPIVRTLFGYYCAPPGATYTVHDAEATIKTINVKPR